MRLLNLTKPEVATYLAQLAYQYLVDKGLVYERYLANPADMASRPPYPGSNDRIATEPAE